MNLGLDYRRPRSEWPCTRYLSIYSGVDLSSIYRLTHHLGPYTRCTTVPHACGPLTVQEPRGAAERRRVQRQDRATGIRDGGAETEVAPAPEAG